MPQDLTLILRYQEKGADHLKKHVAKFWIVFFAPNNPKSPPATPLAPKWRVGALGHQNARQTEKFHFFSKNRTLVRYRAEEIRQFGWRHAIQRPK